MTKAHPQQHRLLTALARAGFALAIGCSVVAQAQPLGASRSLYANGRVKQKVERITVDGVSGFRQTDFYENGRIYRQMSWARGVLEGEARVLLPDGQLDKLVSYRRGAIVAYTAYRAGRVETRIPLDRRQFIYRGRPLAVRWQTYYELHPKRGLMGYSPRGLVDTLLLSRMPEDVAQALADLNRFLDQKTQGQISEANNIISCGTGRADVVDDLGLASMLAPGASGGLGSRLGRPGGATTAKGRADIQAAVQHVTQPCAGTSVRGGRSGGDLGGAGERQRQIDQARQALDSAVAHCQASPFGRSSDLVAIGPGTGFKSVSLAQTMAEIEAAEAAAAATTTVAADTGVTVITGLPATAATESGATLLGGFVAVDVLVAGTGVAAAGLAGWAIGTWINDTAVGKAITQFVAHVQEAFEPAPAPPPPPPPPPPAPPPSPPPAAPAPPAPAPPSAGLPDPEADTRSACDKMADFKAACDRSAWLPKQCAAYVGIVTHCTADVTRIQVNPNDGDVFAVACPSQGDRQRLADQLRCQQQGRFGQPAPGESLSCGNRPGLGRDGLPGVVDPGVVDPVRNQPTR